MDSPMPPPSPNPKPTGSVLVKAAQKQKVSMISTYSYLLQMGLCAPWLLEGSSHRMVGIYSLG